MIIICFIKSILPLDASPFFCNTLFLFRIKSPILVKYSKYNAIKQKNIRAINNFIFIFFSTYIFKKYIKNKDIANITIPLLFPHKKIEINPKIA